MGCFNPSGFRDSALFLFFLSCTRSCIGAALLFLRRTLFAALDRPHSIFASLPEGRRFIRPDRASYRLHFVFFHPTVFRSRSAIRSVGNGNDEPAKRNEVGARKERFDFPGSGSTSNLNQLERPVF